MPDVSTPEKLKVFAVEHERRAGVGLLVSGGSTPDGRVPLTEFAPTLRWIKDHTDLILNVHPGVLTPGGVEELASTGVDAVSVDIVGSDETIRGVYGLDATVAGYEENLQRLRDAGVNAVPHVCVGLDYGRIRGEENALRISASIKPETIVLIALIPTAGTAMENVQPPSVRNIVVAAKKALKMSPGSEVSLGCMHSKREKLLLESEALQAGVTRMTLPGRKTIQLAEEMKFSVKHLNSCCCLPRSLEEKATRLG
jgi:uncharacterized radical SAM superfamily protein